MHLVVAIQQKEEYDRKDSKLYSWETRSNDAEARTLQFYYQSLIRLDVDSIFSVKNICVRRIEYMLFLLSHGG